MRLQQKLEAKLLLSPQLKQSLEILRYSMQDLEAYIREEANANPLIELKERDLTMEMARVNKNDPTSYSTYSGDDAFDPITQMTSSGESIELYLMEQLAMQKQLTHTEKEVVLYYIRSLNETGYLDCDVEEVAEYFDVSIHTCERLLAVLHSFEPVGIGARGLKECLRLQLMKKKDAPELAIRFVEQHLEDLADRNFQLLANQYEISEDDVREVFSYIQMLNPHPMIDVQPEKTEYIIPDIIVEEFNGEYIIRINDGTLPQISINTYYEELLRTNEEASAYLGTKLSEAFLLMRGIEQRHETLYKVTKEVVEKQKAFLKLGKKALKPLRLKDIATIVELHESTVSRTISHKYIQMPQGIFPLKDLFVRGVRMDDGTVESSILIKEKIKSIIQNENVRKPLSDQKIVELLMLEGIQIARRTVAKYREELGILQSMKRAKR